MGDDDFVAAPITSRDRQSGYDSAIQEWRTAGLNVASWIRVHKLTVLAKADIVRSLSILEQRDGDSLDAVLCRIFCRRPTKA